MKSAVVIMLMFFFMIVSGQGTVTFKKMKQEDPKEDSLKKFKEDIEFVEFMADADLLEIKMGEHAAKNSLSTDNKEFGQQLVEDHSILNLDLKHLATEKGIVVPATLSKKKQKTWDKMAKREALEIDIKYPEQVLKNHQEMIDRIKKELETGNDPEIKAWAKKKLPILEEHLKIAKDLDDKVKGKKIYGVSIQ